MIDADLLDLLGVMSVSQLRELVDAATKLLTKRIIEQTKKGSK